MKLSVSIEPLSKAHDRRGFSCGIAALDRYFHEQASQDVKRRLCNCFVASDLEEGRVAAYYTLAAASIPFTAMPVPEVKRLPYPVLPATLIGRLAVDSRYQARQLGSALLIDALRRSAEAAPASFVLLVDAKDERAAGFYRRHGSVALASRPLSLFLPITTALKLFGAA